MNVVDMPTCALAKQPAQWSTLPTHRQLTSYDGYAPFTVDGDGTIGQVGDSLEARTWSGRREVLQTQRSKSPWYSIPSKGPNGIAWLAFPNGADPFDWTLMWRTPSGTVSRVANSHVGGQVGHAFYEDPVMWDGRVAWSKPLSTTNYTSTVTVTNLKDGSSTTLDTGRVNGPVLAGGLLVWTHAEASGLESLRAVDAKTLRPVALPSLPLAEVKNYLVGSAKYLAWSDLEHERLSVWEVGSTTVRRYTPPDSNHHFQYLQLTDNHLAWSSGIAFSVMDLRTGVIFDSPGYTVAGGHYVAVSSKYRRSGPNTIDAWDSRTLPPLPCTPVPPPPTQP